MAKIIIIIIGKESEYEKAKALILSEIQKGPEITKEERISVLIDQLVPLLGGLSRKEINRAVDKTMMRLRMERIKEHFNRKCKKHRKKDFRKMRRGMR